LQIRRLESWARKVISSIVTTGKLVWTVRIRSFQIIVGQHLSQNANDKQEVEAGLESIKANTRKLPEKMSMDNGYQSGKKP